MTKAERDIDRISDCIIIGAGPGGLQAAIYLGRYNRKVLLIDRGGGRTAHARSIENFLTQDAIPGKRIIELGLEQAKRFGTKVEKGLVTSVEKKEYFEVATAAGRHAARFVIVSTGVSEAVPPIRNMGKFFGTSFFTCIDCDGYKTTGRKLVVLGRSIETVRVALAMKQIYTDDITLILSIYEPPEDYRRELHDQGIRLLAGEPAAVIGEDRLEGLELKDGMRVPCEVIMANFGYTLNDTFLKALPLRRDAQTGSFTVNTRFESTLNGLYIVGPLNTGNDQAVIAAGEGAVAAIDINKRLLEV